MRFASFMGGPVVRTVVTLYAAVVLLTQRRWHAAALSIVAVGGAGVLNTVLKRIVSRHRPHTFLGIGTGDKDSFPSGHSSGSLALSAATIYVLWHHLPHRLARIGAAVAATGFTGLVGTSRVKLRRHHRSDVVAGYILAALWITLVVEVLGRIERRNDDGSKGG